MRLGFSGGDEMDKLLSGHLIWFLRELKEVVIETEVFDPGTALDEERISALWHFFEEQKERGDLVDKDLVDDIQDCLIEAKDAGITISQVLANAVIKQMLSNIKIGFDVGFSPFKDGFSGLFVGASKRVFGNFVSMLPAAKVAESLKDKGLIVQCVSAASFETMLSPIEVSAAKSNIEKKLSLDLSKKFPAMIAATAPFYFMRNFSTWFAASAEIQSNDPLMMVIYRGMLGFFAGAISSLPDSLANRSMAEVARTTVEEGKSVASAELTKDAVIKVFQQIASDPKAFWLTTLKAAPFRAFGGAFTAVIYSDEGSMIIENLAKITARSAIEVSEFLSSEKFLTGFLEKFKTTMEDETKVAECFANLRDASVAEFVQIFSEALEKEINPASSKIISGTDSFELRIKEKIDEVFDGITSERSKSSQSNRVSRTVVSDYPPYPVRYNWRVANLHSSQEVGKSMISKDKTNPTTSLIPINFFRLEDLGRNFLGHLFNQTNPF